MHNFLKRLELQGFKSFANKTAFDFPHRVVGVVGPNGSGKSNIIDALRWALGEREAKQLRGDTLGNLIFSGTPKRAPVGFAKVVLIFDNRERIFPFDVAEVTLARRVERLGTSHFFLQDEEIRLRDLVPLLARARLGTRGITMISQGQGDLFVRSGPLERRAMIEEVLGLREFRIKKEQAERRLETSAGNMEKVRAMLEELLPHLRLLRRQRTRWEKRSEIEETLRCLENEYAVFRIGELEQNFGKTADDPLRRVVKSSSTTRLRSLEEARRAGEAEIRSLEKDMRAADQPEYNEEAMRKVRAELTRVFAERTALERERARVEVRMELQEQATQRTASQVELTAVLRRLYEEAKAMVDVDDARALREKVRAWVRTLEQLFAGGTSSAHGELLREKEKMDRELKRLEEGVKNLREREDAFLAEQQEANKVFRERVALLESKKNNLRSLESKIQVLRFEEEKLRLRREEFEREWQSWGRQKSELERAGLPERAGSAGADGIALPDDYDVPSAERKMARLRNELASIGDVDQNLVREAEESEERHAFLSRELQDLEQASKDLRNLIHELDERIHGEFKEAFRLINNEFNSYFRLMFGGGKAHLKLQRIAREPVLEVSGVELQTDGVAGALENNDDAEHSELAAGVEIDIQIPKKKIVNLEMLSGGEKNLVSLAALFALIAVSPPPFLVLDEIDATLDEENALRFSELIREFSSKTQFIVVTHNRITMEAADALYGVTMGDDGVSKILSLKLDSEV